MALCDEDPSFDGHISLVPSPHSMAYNYLLYNHASWHMHLPKHDYTLRYVAKSMTIRSLLLLFKCDLIEATLIY